MRRGRCFAAAAVLLTPVVLAWAGSVTAVTQLHRGFSVGALTIAAGDVIRFSNADEFLHQIYVKAASFSFESAGQESGESLDIAFPVRGTFEVRCEIHPKMLLTVTVR